jgi:hypothetical protein
VSTQLSARTRPYRKSPVNFEHINQAALAILPYLLARWLPSGRMEGHEYVALNPKRGDRSLGSFSINILNGKWGDFARDARGGDVVSLAAYLGGIRLVEAAERLAKMLGIEARRGR